jgi:hypothetical protein
MRTVLSMLVLFLAACTAQPSLEELEKEAMVSGNWTAVEQREEAMQRRQNKAASSCSTGQTTFCAKNGTD